MPRPGQAQERRGGGRQGGGRRGQGRQRRQASPAQEPGGPHGEAGARPRADRPRGQAVLPGLPAQGAPARRVQGDGRGRGGRAARLLAAQRVAKPGQGDQGAVEESAQAPRRHRPGGGAGLEQRAGGGGEQQDQADGPHGLRVPERRQPHRARDVEMLEPANRASGAPIDPHKLAKPRYFAAKLEVYHRPKREGDRREFLGIIDTTSGFSVSHTNVSHLWPNTENAT